MSAFFPLSLDPRDWRMVSLNPNDAELMHRNGDVLESVGGYGLSWYVKEEFANFVLMVDWRISCRKDNSGVFIRTPGPDIADPLNAARDTGHEAQIDERGFDSGDGTEGHPKKKTGAIYDLQAPSQHASHNAGVWNTYLIGACDDQIWVVLNGKLVNDYRSPSDRRRSGFIALQAHNPESHVQFRDLQIMRLP